MKKNSSVQRKISISFLYMSAFFVIITASVVGTAITQFYRLQLGERLENEQIQLNNMIEEIALDANDFANKVIIQLNANRMISLKEISQEEAVEVSSMNYIMNVITNNFRITSDIDSVNILFDNNRMYSIKNNGSPQILSINQSIREELSNIDITTKGGFQMLSLSQQEKELFFCKEIRDIDLNSSVGIIFLEVSTKRVSEYYNKSEDAAFVVSDEMGEVVVKTDNLANIDSLFMPQNSVGRIKLEETTWQYNWKPVSSTKWNLMCLQDEETGVKQIYSVVIMMILFATSIMLCMALVTLLLAKRISKPIIELSEHMTKHTGKLPKPMSVPEESNEVTTLYESFNSMLSENKELFHSYKEKERQRNEIELALMQSQIKPHFLYNTLDTIYCLSEMGKTNEASYVTKALADYYRQVLNQGEDKITLERELIALKQYLKIMEVRYRNIISYEISCEDEVKHVVVPKLLLQPLVENAIYHGIKPKKDKGFIKIFAKKIGGIVEISVSDDGIGMSQERFEEALSSPDLLCDSETFGMYNLIRRLQLFYGEKSTIELRNNQENTTIVVVINLSEAKHV